MHEMSIARSIIDIVEEQLRSTGNAHPSAVRVRIGDMAGIVPESLEFCFQVLAGESEPLRGVTLRIDRVPVRARCKSCGAESQLEVPAFFCSSCESTDLDLLTGTELDVVAVEFTARNTGT